MVNIDGNAIVYCEGAFNTPNGKTAHGLVRFTKRYEVIAVIDSSYAGQDSGMVLDRKENGIPIVAGLDQAIQYCKSIGKNATHFVVGLAPDGGRLSPAPLKCVKSAIRAGLNVDSGLHDYLIEDHDILLLTLRHNVNVRDIRRPKSVDQHHFFTGKIEQVDALKIAVLGTDSAVGKRTTAWKVTQALENAGYKTEMVGTGQTAWMQGAKYSIVMDSIINDFVSGEIEHAVYSAWKNERPDVIVIEGQGSLMNPAYPGGFEIMAAGRPDIIILQHAPARIDYDGFPGYRIQPLETQIKVIELLSGKPVVAITVNHEGIELEFVGKACEKITMDTGIPATDVLIDEPEILVGILDSYLKKLNVQ